MNRDEKHAVAGNVPDDKDLGIWEVMSCLYNAFTPVAAFTNPEYAKLLANYFRSAKDTLDPAEDEDEIVLEAFVKKVSSTDLELDVYLPELESGKLPYCIKMEMNGRLFSAVRADTIYESMITTIYYAERTSDSAIQIESKAIYAIFWATDKREAVILAEEHVINLNALGAFD